MPTAAAKPQEYENFEDLTRRLLKVSKTELDEKRERKQPTTLGKVIALGRKQKPR